MRRTDEAPLGGGLGLASEGEAPESSRLLDLAEDGFDNGFPHAVDPMSGGGFQFRAHGGHPGFGCFGWLGFVCFLRLRR